MKKYPGLKTEASATLDNTFDNSRYVKERPRKEFISADIDQ
jgi:hypothetical protein